MLTLKVIQNTVIKTRPLQSAELGAKDKFSAKTGEVFQIESYEKTRCNHYRVILKAPREGQKVFYCYIGHFMLLEGGKELGAMLPEAVDPLLIPYHSQLDNIYNPNGACNVTSLSMCLAFLGVRASAKNIQLEDELYNFMESTGRSRHDAYKLAEVAGIYGVKDTFTERASIRDAKKAIAAGKPCIVHGYFTNFGHIIVLCGYNKTGFICHDPYGKLNNQDAYDSDLNGRFVCYPYSQFERLAMPDTYLYLHILEKM